MNIRPLGIIVDKMSDPVLDQYEKNLSPRFLQKGLKKGVFFIFLKRGGVKIFCFLYSALHQWVVSFYTLFLISGLVFLFVSCQMFQNQPPLWTENLKRYQEGGFKGHIEWVEGKNQPKHRLRAEITVSKQGSVRMDFTAAFHIPVVTLLIDKTKILALFFQTKEYYQASVKEATIPFPGLPLKRTLLRDILFYRLPPEREGWSCQKDLRQGVQCIKTPVRIAWKLHPTRVEFQKGDQMLVFYIRDFASEGDEALFHLKIPKNFKPVKSFK